MEIEVGTIIVENLPKSSLYMHACNNLQLVKLKSLHKISYVAIFVDNHRQDFAKSRLYTVYVYIFSNFSCGNIFPSEGEHEDRRGWKWRFGSEWAGIGNGY